VKDLTPREILDAIDRSLEKVAQQFAKEQAETKSNAQQTVAAGEVLDGQSVKTGAV